MQAVHFILTGMETGYMRKLALYLQKRLENGTIVSIWSRTGTEDTAVERTDSSGDKDLMKRKLRAAAEEETIVLLGEKSAVQRLKSEIFKEAGQTGHPEKMQPEPSAEAQTGSGRTILELYLAERPGAKSEDTIFAYQSCEAICRSIQKFCQKNLAVNGAAGSGENVPGNLRLILISGCADPGDMLAFSMAGAALANEQEETLFLNLGSCTGMAELFQAETQEDFSDLISAVRQEEALLETCTFRVDELDCILPPENPVTFSQLQQTDLQKLLLLLERQQHYRTVWIYLQTCPRGSELLFEAAERMICLTGSGLAAQCRKSELKKFFENNRGNGRKWMEIACPQFFSDEPGPHLLSQWCQGTNAAVIRRILNETRLLTAEETWG